MMNKNIRKRPTTNEVTMPRRIASAESTKNDSNNVYFQHESCKEILVQHESKATATLESETDFSRDARAIRERVLKEASKGKKNKVLYKGICHYTDYRAGFRREQNKAGGVHVHGPLRASAHIRVTSRFDFQPDICKDYKQTGYCGYGDSCKFVHDRCDYKSGWQMEKEWEEAEKAREWEEAEKARKRMRNYCSQEDMAAYEDDHQDCLPCACSICRQPFVDPVVTVCKHYFCGNCAVKHHLRNKKCFVCDQPTQGTFNIAREIRKRMGGANKR